MKYPDPKSVVAFSAADHKHAALFFERIVPLHSAKTVPREITWPFFEEVKMVAGWWPPLRTLFETELDNYTDLPKRFKIAIESMGVGDFLYDTIDELIERGRPPKWTGVVSGAQLEQAITEALRDMRLWNDVQHFHSEMRNGLAVFFATNLPAEGLHFVPVLGESTNVETKLPEGQDDSIFWTLSNLKLVKTETAEWDQIIELRHDAEASRKLRNFRLFLSESFSGRSQAYVRDALEQKIEDYESACKKHGFELMLTSMKSLLDSKSALGFAALVTVGILTGQRTLTNVAAGLGAVFESSRFVLSLVKAKHDLSVFKRDHELAYVFQAREHLQHLVEHDPDDSGSNEDG